MIIIAICDDEVKDIQRVKAMIEAILKEYGIMYIIHTFTSGEDLIVSKDKYDIIFLDISMQGINGIETGMLLYRKNWKVRIIYITSYETFCNDAMNSAHAFAYMTKPIEKELLKTQLKELMIIWSEEKKNEVDITLENVRLIDGNHGIEYKSINISISKILYFEHLKTSRRIKVCTNDKVYEYSGTMTETIKKVERYGFGICYRGILINLAHVVRVKGDNVWLNNEEVLPLSPKRAVQFKEQLINYIHRSMA